MTDEVHDDGIPNPILLDPHQEKRDCRLLERAVREGWPIKPEHRAAILNRLLRVIEKDEVAVPTRDGGVEFLEEPADRNAIAASKAVIAMAAQNQADEHFDAKAPPVEATINIGAIGNLSLGQEPLTLQDAKMQAQEILRLALARSKPPSTEPPKLDDQSDLSRP